jgi:hypothetical protein
MGVGSAKAQGSKAKPTSHVRAAQSNQSEGRSDTMDGQQLTHLEAHRGDTTSSSFVSESQPGGFLYAPSCGLAPSHPGFPARDYQGKMLKTTLFRFHPGGALAPVWSYGEALALASSHP